VPYALPAVCLDISSAEAQLGQVHATDTQSELMNYQLDFLIGSTFRICSPIGSIHITLPSHQSTNNSDRAEHKYDVYYLYVGIGRMISIVNGYSLSAGNLIPRLQTNDYSLMLQWFGSRGDEVSSTSNHYDIS